LSRLSGKILNSNIEILNKFKITINNDLKV
jgi:hypothetical protein